MRTALIVMNPRRICAVKEHFDALVGIDIAYVKAMDELRAMQFVNETIAQSRYDRYLVCSDDVLVTQEALDAVLGLHSVMPDACVTGYCNLDNARYFETVNLCSKQLPPPPISISSYSFVLKAAVETSVEPFPTTFAGLALTCMSRELWERFPLKPGNGVGCCDYMLSFEMGHAGVEIVAAPGAFVRHLKEQWNHQDQNPEHALLIGIEPPAVEWAVKDPA